jgi:ribose 5-phosphate isomerase B
MFEPKIYVASDREGCVMKQEIVQHLTTTNKQYSIEDIGPKLGEDIDFPTHALMIADLVKENPGEHFGVLISTTGNEMAVAANKIKDIRAVVCWNIQTAEQGRKILDANIICIPADITTQDSPLKIIDAFIKRGASKNMKHFRRRWLLEKLVDAL